VSAVDLGELKKIKIEHDGSGIGAGWHLEKIIVEAALLGKRWVFPCNEWLDKGKGDGTLERVLFPAEEDTVTFAAKVPYEVVFKTSDLKGAGTDANVFIDLYGTTADGEQRSTHFDFESAVKEHFEPGREDHFNVELDDVGVPFKLRLGHDGKGMFSSWHVQSVTLINQANKESFHFECNCWLSKDKEDKKLVREFTVAQHKALTADGKILQHTASSSSTLSLKKYLIHVFTGDERGAGTDANVCFLLVVFDSDGGMTLNALLV
jgi:hypothetical protein